MSKESFLYPETKSVFDLIEETSQRSGVSRGQAFEDFLIMSCSALSGGQMEDQYMATVKKHAGGKPGQRGCDSIAHAFGALTDVMEKTRLDILGDLFQGAISYGESGLFLTPEPVCQMMAQMTVGEAEEGSERERKTVCDPAVGSGRMLLAVANLRPHWEFWGCDVDVRCVRITSLNLALRNLYGYVIWGNSLKNEKRLVYRTGFNLRGFIREIPIADCPPPVQALATETPAAVIPNAANESSQTSSNEVPPRVPGQQLRFF